MKIMITGATGYIGHKLAHTLANEGHIVHAFIRSPKKMQLLNHPNIKIFYGDILNPASLVAAMGGCNQVYHTAGMVNLWSKDPNEFFIQNVTGTQNVLDAAIQTGIKKLVYTSTCGVWGPSPYEFTENDPRVTAFDNDYDLSKHLAEKLVLQYGRKGLCTVIVNLPRVFGPGLDRASSGVNRFIKWLLYKKVCAIPWHLNAKANYAFIDDVVKGHILAMKNGLGCEKYILGGENLSYKDLITITRKLSGMRNLLLPIPLPLIRFWGWTEILKSRLTNHQPAITPDVANRFMKDKMFDCSKAINQLGYRITPFSEALSNTILYLNQRS